MHHQPARQPDALLWNLIRLAECLLPLAEAPALEAVLHGFDAAFQEHQAAAMLRRLGLAPCGPEPDAVLVRTVWTALREGQVGFERFFHDWYGGQARRGWQRPEYAGEAFAPLRALLPG